MKAFKVFVILTGLILTPLVFNSCLSDDDDYSLGKFWISIATVEPLDNNTYSLILDDGTKLWPAAGLALGTAALETVTRSAAASPALGQISWTIRKSSPKGRKLWRAWWPQNDVSQSKS